MAVKDPLKRDLRFEAELVVGNWLDRLQVSTASTRVQIQRVYQTHAQRRLGFHGVMPNEVQYQGDIRFSDDDGHTFTEPLVNAPGNRILQIRLALSQYQVEPPIRGWALDWFLPAGWVWTDGLGQRTYEENVSNPVVIARTMRSPSNPQPVGFRVLIMERFI